MNRLIDWELTCPVDERVRRQRIAALRRYNPLLELMEKVPHAIDSGFLSSSKYIHWDIIVQNPHINWIWEYISINPNITPEIARENPRQNWSQFMLMQNPNTRLETCIEQLRCGGLLMKAATLNPRLTFEFVLNNISLNWNWSILCENKTIACTANILKYPHLPWDYNIISKHVDREVFVAHINENWNWHLVSARPFVTIDFLKQYPRLRWDWRVVIVNPTITWNDIIINPQFPWQMWKFSANPNLTDEILRRHPTVSWSNYQMSLNTGINMKIIRMMGHQYTWNVLELSANKGITIDIIRYFNPTCMLAWEDLSANPAITHKIIMENPDLSWDISGMIKNPNIEPEMILEYLKLRARICSEKPKPLSTDESATHTPAQSTKKVNGLVQWITDKFKRR
jgi:hypothetical protein